MSEGLRSLSLAPSGDEGCGVVVVTYWQGTCAGLLVNGPGYRPGKLKVVRSQSVKNMGCRIKGLVCIRFDKSQPGIGRILISGLNAEKLD